MFCSVRQVVQVVHSTAHTFCLHPCCQCKTQNPSDVFFLKQVSQKINLYHQVLYLKEDIRCIMQTHDQCASSYHIVAIGECDEHYGGQVVDKHDHEILPSKK